MNAARSIITIILITATISVFGNEADQKAVTDAIRRYEIVKKYGDIKDIHTQASKVAEAYLQLKDEKNYKKWKETERLYEQLQQLNNKDPKARSQAQYSLGDSYSAEESVKKDYTEAVKWYHKAAEQGDAQAQDMLGRAYLEGKGVEKDYAEAVKWFRKAAEQGHAEAERQLIMILRAGR